MVPCTRRRLLRSGAVTGGVALAGCLSFGSESECEAGRTSYTADASLSGSTSWPTYRYDAGNTGYNPDATVPAEVAVRWRYTACAETESGVAVANGRVYPGAAVLDGRAGTRTAGEWHGYQTTPTLVDGTRYVGTHELEAFDAASEDDRWTFDPDGESGGLSAPKAWDALVFVAGNFDAPILYAVDATDGTERWRFEPDAEVGTTPAVADDTVFVVDDGGTVHGLDAATGEPRWSHDESDQWRGPPVATDGTVYVTSHDSGVLALDAADGREQWRFADASGVAAPVAVADGAVVAAGSAGQLVALAAADGTVRWEAAVGGELGPPTVAGETVLVGERRGTRVAAHSLADGRERWRFETREILFGDYTRVGTPAGPTAVDETVFVPTAASDCYALGAPVESPTGTAE